MNISLRRIVTLAALSSAVFAAPAIAGGGVSWSLSVGGGGYPGYYPPPPVYRPAPAYNNYSNYYAPPIIYGNSVQYYEAPPPVIIYGNPQPQYWRGPPPPRYYDHGHRNDYRGYRDGYPRGPRGDHDHRR